MCGIVGILRNLTTYIPLGTVERMLEDISHRGPDDEGMVFLSNTSAEAWQVSSEADAEWTIALGSRRLSILDLSSAGHMPMVYQNKFWCVYNGEVYNFIEVRAELEKLGYGFCSSSDTEVILVAYAQWGPNCFTRFRGMWGCLIFDSIRSEAILCRDRLGIKPLYIWQRSGMIAIASEIKQFLHLPGFTRRINLTVATEYLYTGYEDPTRSFFQDIFSLPAGTWLRIPLNTLVPSTPTSYWHPEQVQVSVTNAEEAGQLFADKLRECISIHLRSDVPVGCALSGGLDSNAIAVLVNELKNEQGYPLYTFTSTFPGDKTDEREYVDAVVSSIRATPHHVTPNPATFFQELDQFLYYHDEPIGGLSIYAGYCIARLTREAGIPVTLNGQGGDEILSGYWQSYFLHLRELGLHGQILPLMSHFIGAMMGKGNPDLLDQVPIMLRRYRARSNPPIQVHSSNKANADKQSMLKKILALREQDWCKVRSRIQHKFRFWYRALCWLLDSGLAHYPGASRAQ